jgi:hypothetical protein
MWTQLPTSLDEYITYLLYGAVLEKLAVLQLISHDEYIPNENMLYF